MSGLADRRGDPAFWATPIRWQRVNLRRKPPCDDCIITTHDHRDDPDWREPIQRGMWRRRAGETVTVVCIGHRGEWLAAELARAGQRPPAGWNRFNR